MGDELPKETPDGLEEIKSLLISGRYMKPSQKGYKSIRDYKNYRKWWDLITKDFPNEDYVGFYILNYLKDYLDFYF